MMMLVVARRPLHDPEEMTGFELDDYAASWQRRLGLAKGTFQRDEGEPDQSYRLRLLKMIRDTVESA